MDNLENTSTHLSEEDIRLQKLENLRKDGINPFGI